MATKKRTKSGSLGTKQLVQMYRDMFVIRRFEEAVITQFQADTLPGFLHVAIGQEAIAVGVSHALEDGDFIGSTHRAHGHILARGSGINEMMAELMGKITGYCQGKGGSMHVADMSHNVVGANGVVGSGAPMMTGVALSQKMQDTGNISVVFYGDGASNQGNVFEAMNLAQLWQLPILFICEDNGYAESTPFAQHSPVEDLIVRGAGVGMKSVSVDGNDIAEVYAETLKAAKHARSGKGPVYLVMQTKRLTGHYVGDPQVYREKSEAKEWKADDPIPALRNHLIDDGQSEDSLDLIEQEVTEAVDQAVKTALAADYPPAEDALKHVYSQYPYPGPVTGV